MENKIFCGKCKYYSCPYLGFDHYGPERCYHPNNKMISYNHKEQFTLYKDCPADKNKNNDCQDFVKYVPPTFWPEFWIFFYKDLLMNKFLWFLLLSLIVCTFIQKYYMGE